MMTDWGLIVSLGSAVFAGAAAWYAMRTASIAEDDSKRSTALFLLEKQVNHSKNVVREHLVFRARAGIHATVTGISGQVSLKIHYDRDVLDIAPGYDKWIEDANIHLSAYPGVLRDERNASEAVDQYN